MRARPVSCAFTGHRPEKLPWGENERDPRCMALKEKLRDAIETTYAEGYRHFICGMARGVDLYCCELCLALRDMHQEVTVEAAIPYVHQADHWPVEERERYQDLLERCDFETVIQENYDAGCFNRRNRYMVDHASLLIAVNDGQSGGTRQTILYAMSRKIPIVDLPIE